ncbi:MAG: hypothetical protein ACD_21C00202G0010 [uncultured bacterium]|nr:MAG: hypothetical protein ACD_21C00202G0010 [uncultured bacterium]
MTWKTVFQTYQNPEIGKKGKLTANNTQQVSQFSQVPPFGEIKKRGLDLKNLKSFLGDDWDDYKDNPEALKLWADLLFTNNLIEQGQVPDNFAAITRCNSCGYVYVPSELTNGGSVLGCPWCWNRVKGLPIPKPVITH